MEFNVEKVTNEIIEFIRDYYRKNNLKGAVIGISGGKDSGVVAGLFAKALGPENVVGVWIPCHSKEEDKQDAIKVANHFGFELMEYDLTPEYDSYVRQIKEKHDATDEDLKDANINIKPRMRTATLYYHAAMLSSLRDGTFIVPGTSNKCEIYVGYFTKGGDNVADIQVLADLTVDEVIKIGEYIGVPNSVVHKTPDDGLSVQSDEEKLGVSYKDIAKVMAGEPVDEEVRDIVLRLHRRNAHKFNIPTYRKDGE